MTTGRGRDVIVVDMEAAELTVEGADGRITHAMGNVGGL